MATQQVPAAALTAVTVNSSHEFRTQQAQHVHSSDLDQSSLAEDDSLSELSASQAAELRPVGADQQQQLAKQLPAQLVAQMPAQMPAHLPTQLPAQLPAHVPAQMFAQLPAQLHPQLPGTRSHMEAQHLNANASPQPSKVARANGEAMGPMLPGTSTVLASDQSNMPTRPMSRSSQGQLAVSEALSEAATAAGPVPVSDMSVAQLPTQLPALRPGTLSHKEARPIDANTSLLSSNIAADQANKEVVGAGLKATAALEAADGKSSGGPLAPKAKTAPEEVATPP